MTNALVVADDLTGAMDTGHAFAARGREVTVSLDGAGPDEMPTGDPRPGDAGPALGTDDHDVLVVDADTRRREPSVAAERVAAVVDGSETSLVYKKVDSTLRGNVVAEVDAAVDAAGADVAVVAPAFPATDRTTVEGHHYVDGTPLAAAGYGVDDSELRTIFSGSRYPVVDLPIEVVDGGPGSVRDALAAALDGDRSVLVVADATEARHLAAVADGTSALDTDAVLVGSGGLAGHVDVPGERARPDGTRSSGPRSESGTGTESESESRVLAVVGSVNERTLAQLREVPDELVVELDPAAGVRDPESTGRGAVAALRARLDDHDRAVLTAATEAGDVRSAESAARAVNEAVEVGSASARTGGNGGDGGNNGEGGDASVLAGDRIASALATATAATRAGAGFDGLFLTGGAVARAVLTALGADAIVLQGVAVAEGIPEGRIATGPAAGTRVVTKAGGFGDTRVILNCLDALGT